MLTDPGEHADLLTGLPSDLPGLARVVQGALIHPFELDLYHVQLSPNQREEVNLRSVAQMLARMRELDPAPLTVAREPAQRLVGNCRDHAVLFTSLLRQQGVPARVQALPPISPRSTTATTGSSRSGTRRGIAGC
jgi:hypothetical protein